MLSMTGFGKGTAEADGREITVELKSVNHRFLDINIRLPRNLSFLEETVRDVLRSNLSRGHIEVWITYNNTRDDARSVRVDKGLLDAYLKAFDILKTEYEIPDDIGITSVARLPDVIVVEEPEDDIDAVSDLARKAAQAAVDEVLAMRASEGERLKTDMIRYIRTIGEALEAIKRKAPLVVTEYSQKLKKSIVELLDGAVPDETRFNQEVAYYADRCSIEEETVRLAGHIEHVLETLDSSQPVGRKLDFLIQEMNREANTIGSKASDMEIINNVVLIKGEIEKLREQVQNIE